MTSSEEVDDRRRQASWCHPTDCQSTELILIFVCASRSIALEQVIQVVVLAAAAAASSGGVGRYPHKSYQLKVKICRVESARKRVWWCDAHVYVFRRLCSLLFPAVRDSSTICRARPSHQNLLTGFLVTCRARQNTLSHWLSTTGSQSHNGESADNC